MTFLDAVNEREAPATFHGCSIQLNRREREEERTKKKKEIANKQKHVSRAECGIFNSSKTRAPEAHWRRRQVSMLACSHCYILNENNAHPRTADVAEINK